MNKSTLSETNVCLNQHYKLQNFSQFRYDLFLNKSTLSEINFCLNQYCKFAKLFTILNWLIFEQVHFIRDNLCRNQTPSGQFLRTKIDYSTHYKIIGQLLSQFRYHNIEHAMQESFLNKLLENVRWCYRDHFSNKHFAFAGITMQDGK